MKDIDDVHIIHVWPGTTATNWKTPTRIAYQRENKNMKKNTWGFKVQSEHISYSWTKLLLDKNANPGGYDDPALRKLTAGGMMKLPYFRDATGVCQDFLQEVCTWAFQTMRSAVGSATFDLTPKECWITHPAIWSEEAKKATEKAAQQAGFANGPNDSVVTIAKPEAAAIASLHKSVRELNPVKPGESVLICDCGGGTVDITTYTIIQVTPRLEFDELCVGVGGKCGATWLDRNLHALLSQRFGAAFDSLPDAKKGPGSLFMEQWEKFKRTFGSDDDDEEVKLKYLKMKVADSEHYDKDEKSVILSRADMQAIFDPAIDEIRGLVAQQFHECRVKKEATIGRIILVGGFGSNPYLFQNLSDWCEKNGKINLLCPPNAQAAVVRGAALRGLDSFAAPRIKRARRHYGYSISMLFREEVDPMSLGYVDDFDDEKYCRGRMEWVLRKDDPVSKGTSRTFDVCRNHTPGSSFQDQTTLYSSTRDIAPEHKDTNDLELVGSIVAELPANFHFGDALKSRYSSRLKRRVYEVSYQIRIIFGNLGDTLTFQTLVRGEVAASATIEFGSSA